jgi:hypothetical protein
MIFTFLNGDVIKTSEITLVSRIEQYDISRFAHKFYYNITLNNKIEIERYLICSIDKHEICKQLQNSFYISVRPMYEINNVKGFDKGIQISASYLSFVKWDEQNIIDFEKLDSFKLFNQERLDLIDKLS